MTPGVGGFIDISQNTKKVIFCGTMTASKGLTKFKNQIEQISFNGRHALENGQRVLYVTELAVFELTQEGLELIEIFPGVDLEKDILANMEFKPIIRDPKEMRVTI